MGKNKALLRLPGSDEPLVRHIARRLAPLVTDRLIIVANDPDVQISLPGNVMVEYVQDSWPNAGPLGGIAAGLSRCSSWAAVVACDMPFVSADLLRLLYGFAQAEDATGTRIWDAVVPVAQGHFQSLCALYHHGCLATIETYLAAGHRQVLGILPKLHVCYVQQEALQAVDPGLLSFMNINSPEDRTEACTIFRTIGL